MQVGQSITAGVLFRWRCSLTTDRWSFELDRRRFSDARLPWVFPALNTSVTYLLIMHHTRLTAFFSGTTQVSRYQKGKTNLDFTEARDSEWQWHQLGRMQVCTSLQTDNHTSTPPLSFLQTGCPSCRPTNSVKALKEMMMMQSFIIDGI